MSESSATRQAGAVPGREWQLRPVRDEAAGLLQRRLGLHPVTARVLAGRGVESPEQAEAFLQPGLDTLHDPFLFRDMTAAVERLLAALRHHERIVVHGDYDVDGITGTVLLVTVLRHLGADVEFLLPHRIEDGYGLTPASIDKVVALGGRVLIAVDCGITALAAADRARDKDIDLIVVDHHLPKIQLPQALALLNPRVAEAGYPEQDLAAVGLAFKLARALLRRHPRNLSGVALLKLVALGTVADLVALTGENRVMTYHGLAGLAEATNPGLRALMQVASVDPARVSASDVAFRLAPRINAAGRLGHPDEAAALFLATDEQQARQLAGRLQRLNEQRRQLEQEVFEQAAASRDWSEDPILVAAGAGWHRGVIGIVASRMVERWQRPALVVSVCGEVAHGSARSVPGFDIAAALGSVAPLLQDWGGHRQAAGFRLEAAAVPALREALIAQAAKLEVGPVQEPLLCDGELAIEQIDIALALELERLAPFGVGNPRPRFICADLQLARTPRLLGEAHLKLLVRGDPDELEAVGWRKAQWAPLLAGADTATFVATLRAHRWAGRLRPQLQLQDLRI